MPYIDPADRLRFESLQVDLPRNAGELNYLLTLIASAYYHSKNANYQAINDIIGALEGCKLEFYRRIAAPYENMKQVRNGDVPGYSSPYTAKKGNSNV